MINRDNYLAAREFLTYQAEVYQRDKATIKRNWIWLAHLLRWSDETPFLQAASIRPVFPQYLTVVITPVGGKISKLGVKRICTSARAFFNWLKIHSRAYAGLEANWIDTLYPPRMGDEPRKERDAVTLEMVRTLREVPDNGNLKTRRDKAAAAFLFLTGMRATAFVTMPINCFDLAKRMVKQYPTLGSARPAGRGGRMGLLRAGKPARHGPLVCSHRGRTWARGQQSARRESRRSTEQAPEGTVYHGRPETYVSSQISTWGSGLWFEASPHDGRFQGREHELGA